MKIKFLNFGVFISVSLILGGLVLIALIGYFYIQKKVAIAQTQGTNVQITLDQESIIKAPEVISGHPVRIVIPALGKDLQILDGYYNPSNGEWTLSEKGVYYAIPSTIPNDLKGNTLIYGHYNRYVFSSLHTIKNGQEAYIYTTNNYKFTYKFNNANKLKPTDTNLFSYSGSPKLIIQTCTGRFYQDRLLHHFDFVSAEKINAT